MLLLIMKHMNKSSSCITDQHHKKRKKPDSGESDSSDSDSFERPGKLFLSIKTAYNTKGFAWEMQVLYNWVKECQGAEWGDEWEVCHVCTLFEGTKRQGFYMRDASFIHMGDRTMVF